MGHDYRPGLRTISRCHGPEHRWHRLRKRQPESMAKRGWRRQLAHRLTVFHHRQYRCRPGEWQQWTGRLDECEHTAAVGTGAQQSICEHQVENRYPRKMKIIEYGPGGAAVYRTQNAQIGAHLDGCGRVRAVEGDCAVRQIQQRGDVRPCGRANAGAEDVARVPRTTVQTTKHGRNSGEEEVMLVMDKVQRPLLASVSSSSHVLLSEGAEAYVSEAAVVGDGGCQRGRPAHDNCREIDERPNGSLLIFRMVATYAPSARCPVICSGQCRGRR